MPAPDTIQTQTPGEPTTSQASTETTPQFAPEHRGGGRWVVIDTTLPKIDDKHVKVGDFVGTKDEALAEAQRLEEGGEPFVKPSEPEEPEPTTSQASGERIDPTALKAPVLTPQGWLCPEPKPE